MNLDLTDEETAVLLRELNGLIDGDRYFLSPRIKTLKAIRAKMRPSRLASHYHRRPRVMSRHERPPGRDAEDVKVQIQPPVTATLRRFAGFRLTIHRPLPDNLLGVIPEIDIWRVANLMLKRYGYEADIEGAIRAEELAKAGDWAGEAVWRRIVDAIGQLENTTPSGPLH